jgi:hypothetical protein
VVQEIALARIATIYCGKDKISWNKFAVAVELFVEVETATHRLSEVMKKDQKYYHLPGWFDYVSELGASLLVDATGRLFRDYKEEQKDQDAKGSDSLIGEDDQHSSSVVQVASSLTKTPGNSTSIVRNTKTKAQPLLSLEYLVTSLSVFDTSMPHDTIYALLAIAKDTTPIAGGERTQQSSDHAQDVLELFTQRKRYNVDYDMPYVAVCREFIQFCILQSLQWDRSRALDIICRPWATEETRLKERRDEKKKKAARDEKEKLDNEWLRQKRDSELNKGRANGNLSSVIGKVALQNQGRPDVNSSVNSKTGKEPDRRSAERNHREDFEDMELPSWVSIPYVAMAYIRYKLSYSRFLNFPAPLSRCMNKG